MDDGSGEITIGGYTQSGDLPLMPLPPAEPFDHEFGGPGSGYGDGFLARFDADGALLYSTYLGGNQCDAVWDLTLDSDGAVIVTGETCSADFPTEPEPEEPGDPYDSSFGGSRDAFLSRLSLDGNGRDDLTYSTFLGDINDDRGWSLLIDTSGDVIVVGRAGGGSKFPIKNAYDPDFNALFPYTYDAFVSRLSLDGLGQDDLLYSTYLGGSADDEAQSVALGADGVITLAGITRGKMEGFPEFPMQNAYDDTFNGGIWDVFVARLDMEKTGAEQLVYSTYLGGAGADGGNGETWGKSVSVVLDDLNMPVVAGCTASSELLPTPDALQPEYGGGMYDGFLARLDLTQTGQEQLTYWTFLGGTEEDRIQALGIHETGLVTVAGWTLSPNFDPSQDYHGNGDVFVARLDIAAEPPPLPPHLVVVLDRTGSMCRIRENNHTRCQDALQMAKDEVDEFCYGEDDPHPDGLVSVWMFAYPPGPVHVSGDFVTCNKAVWFLSQLLPLPPPPPDCTGCFGLTPLADAVCESIDPFVTDPSLAPLSCKDKYLVVCTDGFENYSRGECKGNTDSDYEKTCGEFDDHSWQYNVCNKMVDAGLINEDYSPCSEINVKFFGYEIRRGEPRIDLETGQEVGRGPDPAKGFLEGLATEFEFVRDDDTDVPLPSGACCLPDGSCLESVRDTICESQGGFYQGDDTLCAELECPRACCLVDGTCTTTTPGACEDPGGGTPQAVGEICTIPEACCLSGGDVCTDLDPLCCLEQGGTPQGVGTSCGTSKPCCYPGGACATIDEQCCLMLGGWPKDEPACLGDDNLNLIDDLCEDPVACCMADPIGTCTTKTPVECQAAGGTTQGPRTSCDGPSACCSAEGACFMADPICCVAQLSGTARIGAECLPPEACAMPDGSCGTIDPNCCVEMGGVPVGAGTSCTTPEACCLSDGACEMFDPVGCEALGGVAHVGASCTSVQGCCFDDGRCEDLDPLCCADLGGTAHDPGSLCEAVEACIGAGDCVEIDPDCCLLRGWTPQGPETTCPTERCCFPDGECIEAYPDECTAQGGTPGGPGTSCGSQACCWAAGCQDFDPSCCAEVGGIPQGVGTACGDEEPCCFVGGDCLMVKPPCADELGCEVPVACCLPYGACQEPLSPTECTNSGGTAKPDGQSCDPPQACCLPDGICLDTDSECCTSDTAEGIPQGEGTACAPIGRCCLPDGSCIETTLGCCTAAPASGDYGGDGSHCWPIGACMLDGPLCMDTPAYCCTDVAGGDYRGDGTSCERSPIPTLSEWGMVVMTLLVIAAATVVFLRRRAVRA